MKTKIIIDKRTRNKLGYPVKVYLKFKEKSIYINIGVEVEIEEFNNGIILGRTDAKKLNKIISSKKTKIDARLLDLELSNELYKFTSNSLKRELEGKNVKENKDELLFEPYFVKYTVKFTSLGTIRTFKDTVSIIGKHTDIGALKFSDINRMWLKDFDLYMTNKGLSTNTRGIYLRNIRAVFNDAINNEIVDFGIYPFRRFSIKTEDSIPRAMTKEQLISLKDFQCTPAKEKYRDLFMLSFYLRGLNMKDILFLKHGDVCNGYLQIKRSKTTIPLEIKLEPEALEIVEKYKGLDYLISPMDTRENYRDFERYMNKQLKSIGIEKEGVKIIKQPFKYLSIYWARHTWATIAGEIDIPDKIISIGLGHKQKQTITDVYINRNKKKVDDANRKVLDFIK